MLGNHWYTLNLVQNVKIAYVGYWSLRDLHKRQF